MAWGGKKGGEKTYIPAGPGDKPGNDPTPWTYLEKPTEWTIQMINMPCSSEPERRAQLLVDGVNVLHCKCGKDEWNGTITEDVDAPIKGDESTFTLKIPRMFVVDTRTFKWSNGKFLKYALRNDGLAIGQQSEPFEVIDATKLPIRNIDIQTIKR